jgi:DNA-binding NarL/FixJ family response regulator
MTITVALVDDDAAMRERVGDAMALDRELELVGSFADARSVLAWLELHSPDVLLVDLGLPDAPGLAVITYCAQRHPATHIMVLTVLADETERAAEHQGRRQRLSAQGQPARRNRRADPPAARRRRADDTEHRAPAAAHLRPPDAAPPKPEPMLEFRLTKAEQEMLNLISRGFKYAEVATLKNISINTVHTHIRNIYAKLSVNSRSEAVFEAGRLGLLDGLFRRDA